MVVPCLAVFLSGFDLGVGGASMWRRPDREFQVACSTLILMRNPANAGSANELRTDLARDRYRGLADR